MNIIQQARQELVTALNAVQGARVHPDLGPGLSPPVLVVGVPALEWQTVCENPTTARFPVYVVVKRDDRTADRLMELLPLVTAAVDGVPDAVVTRADPGSYPTSDGDLPAYQITVEYAL